MKQKHRKQHKRGKPIEKGSGPRPSKTARIAEALSRTQVAPNMMRPQKGRT